MTAENRLNLVLEFQLYFVAGALPAQAHLAHDGPSPQARRMGAQQDEKSVQAGIA